ncbi:MAG: hypothetical protein MUO37_04960 [Methyloceanibacter sp.]|nr:hypothetical protein [Methyloceanibacter sp.]
MSLFRSKGGTRAERVAANNEWMRRYIEETELFEREWKTIERFKAEERRGVTPSYGELCEAYMELLVAQLRTGPPRWQKKANA